MKNKVIGIVDEPNPKGNEDTLDIFRHANALTEYIECTSTPMTIGIQGEWGSGKTSLLNSIYHRLDNKNNLYLQIWINSWEHSLLTSPEEALLKIINEIIQEMLLGDKNLDRKNSINNIASNVMKGALRVGATALGGAKAGEITEELLGKNVNAIKELRNELTNLSKSIRNQNTNPYEKIIIYVDDLDRIEPKDAVQVLELLKNIFSVPNCVFILAIDYQVVVKGLVDKFGIRTEENEWEFRAFFDKIIQLPFMMPMGQYNTGKYVSGLLRQIGFLEGNENLEKNINKIISFSIGGNPRSLKRLVNSLTLINIFSEMDEVKENIESTSNIEESTEDLLLFSLVCMQISYPKIYDLLVKYPNFPDWTEDETAFRVTQKKEEGVTKDEKKKFEKQFNLAKVTEDFDEDWERTLYRICYLTPRYFARVKDISRLLSYLKDELLKDNKDDIENIIKQKISDTAVTNVSTTDEPQTPTAKPFQRTMYSGFDEWKQTQIENMPKQSKARQIASVRLEIQELLHNECSNFFNDKAGFEWKYSKTGGCTGYADKKKFLAITAKGSNYGAINILKDFERDYRLPNIDGFITTHIRPFNPENPNILIGFCEQFGITAPSNENNPFELFKNNLSILLQLISRSYDLATIHRDSIMKELKDPATQEDLDRQKVYLGPDHRYDY